MKPCRYKTLLSYLPGMATVVNSFSSPQVQLAVFEELYRALNARLEQEGVPAAPTNPQAALELKQIVAQTVAAAGDEELEHELVEGDSIHAIVARG